MKRLKKSLALLQVLFLLVTMNSIVDFSKSIKVSAATSGITNGGTYMIVSAYNGKAITQTDLSTFYANCVVWNTDAVSDLAKWTLTERGEYYSITNIVSGKSMKITGNSNGSNCDFNGYDNSNNYKWKLQPITSGEYAGCYYLISAVKNSNGEYEYAEITSDEATKDSDGAQVRLWTNSYRESRQIWRIVPVTADNIKFTETMNDQAVAAFREKYFVKNSTTGYNSLGGGFWGIAEVMEAMLDGYETTGKSVYKEMFEGTYNDFIARNGDFWSYNSFNDDITWAVLDSVRAYLLFGDSRYLTIAKNNYDYMYNRANVRGDGLLLWEMNTEGSNSCINGPATVAACYLGIATGDESYFEKAKTIYAAQREKLYIADGNDPGRVLDSLSNTWCSTYNQGTYLGAAIMLYQHYGEQMYYNDACNIMKYTIKALCYNNILKDENTNSGDLSGMRGILMRYMRKFVVDLNQGDYLSFFKDNAKIAWMNRNSQNIMQCSWQKKTSENVTWDSFAAYNAISLMANMPTYADDLERTAYSLIEAEDMDYCRGLISENSSGTSGGRSIGGVQNNHYTAYYNINFGNIGASQVTFKYSKAPERDGAQARIELRLGSQNGELIGTAILDNTSNWSDWREITVDIARTAGIQNLYLVYKTDTSYACNLDYFKFIEVNEKEEPTTEEPTTVAPKTYSVILDGAVVETVKEGETYTFPKTAKVGYYGDGKLYKKGSTYTVTKNVVFNTVSITTGTGASIKWTEPSGMRFNANLTCSDTGFYDTSVKKTGMLIAPYDFYSEDGNLDFNSEYIYLNVENSGWTGNIGTFGGALASISPNNYKRMYIGRAYVTVEYADESQSTVYSNMSGSRSVGGIAETMLNTESIYSNLSIAQKTLLESYIL